MSGFVKLLVLLHNNLKLFDVGSILILVPNFPSGLVLLFWLEIIFYFPNLL